MNALEGYDRAMHEMRDSTLTPRETFLRAAHDAQMEDALWLAMFCYLRWMQWQRSSKNRTTSD